TIVRTAATEQLSQPIDNAVNADLADTNTGIHERVALELAPSLPRLRLEYRVYNLFHEKVKDPGRTAPAAGILVGLNTLTRLTPQLTQSLVVARVRPVATGHHVIHDRRRIAVADVIQPERVTHLVDQHAAN